jgi:hypothetical protein
MRENKYCILFFGIISATFFANCKQEYLPSGIAKANLSYLVVDGIILNGQDTTVINLSRTQNLTDSTYTQKPEAGALVSIIGQNSEEYDLTNNGNGHYSINQLNLNNNEIYRLKIVTANGNEYLSDSLQVKFNPPIDSISWMRQDDGVHIYANTHDSSGNTRYYRWEYSETWEYHSIFFSAYKPVNGGLVFRDSTNYVNKCWTTQSSANLLLGTSVKLDQDVIYEYPVIFIPEGSPKLSVEYSILVKQYTLTEKAFNFWQALQKSTEQTGSLFDPQPTQLNGNIHCVTNAKEQVLGYISLTSLQQQRIFITNDQAPNWPYDTYVASLNCNRVDVSTLDLFGNPDFWFTCGCIPLNTFSTPNGGTGMYAAIPPLCGDCTLQGGVTTKPSFWPN